MASLGTFLILSTVWLGTDELAAQPVGATVSEAKQNELGILVHEVNSDTQAGTTLIRVLLPSDLDPGKRYRCLYVLPVESGEGQRYGDGLLEAHKQDLHNKHQLVCIAPTFSALPWYADHPSDPQLRQESYFCGIVVPFVEKAYPVRRDVAGRLLVGFSKSGWGAFTLIIRHPDVFGKAAAWDAPFGMDRPKRFGTGPIFGSQENFDAYRVSRLLRERASLFQQDVRLIHLGYGNFREHHQAFERDLTELNIAHVYRDGPKRPHTWDSGWLQEAVQLLADPDGVR